MKVKGELSFGLHAVFTLLEKQPQRVKRLFILKGRQDQRIQKLLGLAEQIGIGWQPVGRSELDQLVEGNHQGVVAEVLPQRTENEAFLAALLDRLDAEARAPLLLVLDGVTDPHNLGACLRNADAAGVHAVIAPKDKSAPLNAVAAKVACGAAETVPYVLVTNLARTLRDLQQRGIWITGTAGETDQSVFDANLTGPHALVMGNEGSGMRRLTRECCDQLIKIPMAGEVSSLNVSVATGICLFEIVRQRRGG